MANQYRAFGHMHSYTFGVTVVVDAETIEEAHDVAGEQLDTVVQVSGPIGTEPAPCAA